MPLPRVTVITPTYNRADFLKQTIESVLAQDYPNLEYIVLDDGSTDHTREVAKPYAEAGRLTYLFHENRGEAETVNRGWEMATGEFFCIVNSDDPQPQNLIRRSVEVMQAHPEVIVTYPDWEMINTQGTPCRFIATPDYALKTMLEQAHCLPGPGALLRRSAIAPHITHLRDKRFRRVSDFESWLRLALIGPFRRIPETLAYWRQHPGGITVAERGVAHAQELIAVLEAFYQRPDLPEIAITSKNRTHAAFYLKAAIMAAMESLPTAIGYGLKALLVEPIWAIRFACYFLLRRLKRIALGTQKQPK